MRRARAGFACAAAALTAIACRTPEDIRVRDRGEVLYSGRARVTWPVTPSRAPTGRPFGAALGAELGAHGTSGDYVAAGARRDYHVTVGYLAAVAELRLDRFRVLPKFGAAVGDVYVEGQNRTLREDGFGAWLGVEGRFELARQFELFGRGSWFGRSSLDATWVEVGAAFCPAEQVALEVGYALADQTIRESDDLFGLEDEADVRTQGLLLSVTLSF